MKITTICLALIGLVSVKATLVGRQINPVPPSDGPGTQMLDAARRGIARWGLNGDLQPPTSPNPPLRSMPFGLGIPQPPPKKHDPDIKTGVTTRPGEPLGPAKKCKPCKSKRQLDCCPSLGKGTKPSKPSARKYSFPRGKTRRVTGASAKAVAIGVLAPHVRKVYEDMKQLPVLGYLLQGFDDAVESIQVAIGGPGRDDIDGNDLKASLICWLKGGKARETIQGRPSNICKPWDERFDDRFEELFQQGKLDETVESCQGYETHENPYKAVEAEFKARCKALFVSSAYSKWVVQKWSNGLDKILEFCYTVHDYQPADDDLWAKIEKDCPAFQEQVDKIEFKPKKSSEGVPIEKIGKCTRQPQCNASKLQPYHSHCGRFCRGFFALSRIPPGFPSHR